MDDNNLCGNAMTKSLPYGCIKKAKIIPSLRKFSFILQNISINDKIRYLFVVYISFNEKMPNEKALLFNEIYTPIFEKKKIIKSY